MNEHDIQYHLKHRQQEFQIDGASQRKAQVITDNNPRTPRRKLKQLVRIVSSLALILMLV